MIWLFYTLLNKFIRVHSVYSHCSVLCSFINHTGFCSRANIHIDLKRSNGTKQRHTRSWTHNDDSRRGKINISAQWRLITFIVLCGAGMEPNVVTIPSRVQASSTALTTWFFPTLNAESHHGEYFIRLCYDTSVVWPVIVDGNEPFLLWIIIKFVAALSLQIALRVQNM